MKILFITPPPSLPSRLQRVRTLGLLNLLAKKHQMYLLSVTNFKTTPPEWPAVQKKCYKTKIIYLPLWKSIMNCFLHPLLPFEVAYCQEKKVRQEITNIIKHDQIDYLYLKRLRSVVYLPDTIDIPVIMDSTDAMSLFYRQAKKFAPPSTKALYYHEWLNYMSLEKKILKKIPFWIVSSINDKHYLERFASPQTKIFVLPNSIDLKYFQPVKCQQIENSVLFSGLMDKLINIDAALFFMKKILPLIKKEIPSIKFYVVGPKPTAHMKSFHNNTDIFIMGYQPDIRTMLNRCQVIVSPLRFGSGIHNKIMQAWAMEKPVVSTTIGASGLSYVSNREILIADQPDLFAQKVIGLLKNKTQQRFIGRQARKRLEEKYSYQQIGNKFNHILNKCNFVNVKS